MNSLDEFFSEGCDRLVVDMRKSTSSGFPKKVKVTCTKGSRDTTRFYDTAEEIGVDIQKDIGDRE